MSNRPLSRHSPIQPQFPFELRSYPYVYKTNLARTSGFHVLKPHQQSIFSLIHQFFHNHTRYTIYGRHIRFVRSYIAASRDRSIRSHPERIPTEDPRSHRPHASHRVGHVQVSRRCDTSSFPCRVGADVDLPVIAVIGSQSAGKSSLIEAISGITLPRAAGTCTR